MTIQPPSWYPGQRRGAPVQGQHPGYPARPYPPDGVDARAPYGAGFGDGAPPGHLDGPRGRQPDWRIVTCAVAAVLVAAFGVVVGLLGSRGSTPRARLESAILATDSAVTADMTLQVKVGISSFSFDVNATGVVDFATNAASLHMNLPGTTLSVVETGGNAYVKVGALVSRQFPGKTWVQVPVAQFAKQSKSDQIFLTDNPTKVMTSLVKLGGTVTPLGTSTIDGSPDQGYRVDFTLADLLAHASQLPPALRSVLSNASNLPKTLAFSTTLYVDPAGHLQAYDLAFSGEATGHPATVSVDLTLSHFGTAATPSPPPATQTVTYQQVQAKLGTSGHAFTFLGNGAVQGRSASQSSPLSLR